MDADPVAVRLPPSDPFISADGASLAPAPARPADAQPRALQRGLDVLVTSLPTLLMALLALGSWWLVKNTPLFEGNAVDPPLRHVPDYTMTVFRVQRFGPDGRMSAQIEGDTLRHYPDDQTLEIDNPRIRSISKEGTVLVATGRTAVSNADASELELRGDAHLVREATADEQAVEFRSAFLHYVQSTERVDSNVPVELTQGATQIHAESMTYDHLARTALFTGKVRAVLVTPPRAK